MANNVCNSFDFIDLLKDSIGGGGDASALEGRIAEIEKKFPIAGSDIQQDTITDIQIADDAITTEKISPGAVRGESIAPNSITGAELANGTVNTTQLADGSVTQSKVKAGTDLTGFVSVDGSSIVVENGKLKATGGGEGGYTLPIANSMTLGGIKTSDTITTDAQGVASAVVKDGSVTPNKMATATTPSAGKILKAKSATLFEWSDAPSATVSKIYPSDLASVSDPITSGVIAAIDDSNFIGIPSFDTNFISDNAITSSKLADNAVVAGKIAPAAVGNGLAINASTKMLEVPVSQSLSYTSDGLDIAEHGISVDKINIDAPDRYAWGHCIAFDANNGLTWQPITHYYSVAFSGSSLLQPYEHSSWSVGRGSALSTADGTYTLFCADIGTRIWLISFRFNGFVGNLKASTEQNILTLEASTATNTIEIDSKSMVPGGAADYPNVVSIAGVPHLAMIKVRYTANTNKMANLTVNMNVDTALTGSASGAKGYMDIPLNIFIQTVV